MIDSLLAQCPDLTGKRFVDALLSDKQLKDAQLSAIALSVEGDEILITNHRAALGVSNERFELLVGGSGSQYAIQHFEQYPLNAFDVPWGGHRGARHLYGSPSVRRSLGSRVRKQV
ncbi:hypothetical protein P4114_26180 [Pseudomonas aeruginosa]|nr:hypothetical protein [Pseudomonas aeruginosa]